MNIHELLERAKTLRIAVIGDHIIDNYIMGEVERISPEAPVPVLRMTGMKSNWGGAGNVVKNLEGLGCNVTYLWDKNHTILKTRVMTGSQHLLRIDDEEREPKLVPMTEIIDDQFFTGIGEGSYDCVVLSDYGKGMINRDTAPKIISFCNERNIHTVVDTKTQISLMDGASVIKCNKKEWEQMRKTIRKWPNNVDYIIVTDGANGMTINSEYHIKGININIADGCGAGDTVTALLAVGLSMFGDIQSIEEICELANIAAAEVCRYPGVVPITSERLKSMYHEIHPDQSSVQSLSVQRDASEYKNEDQANIEGGTGEGSSGAQEGG